MGCVFFSPPQPKPYYNVVHFAQTKVVIFTDLILPAQLTQKQLCLLAVSSLEKLEQSETFTLFLKVIIAAYTNITN